MVAIPSNHPVLKEAFAVPGYSTSIGGTPVACYIRVPFRARIGKIAAVTQGAITTADCTVTIAVNGTTNANLAGTIPVAGAAAGQVATWSPLVATYVNEDDYITITPSGASGSNIACMFGINFIMG